VQPLTDNRPSNIANTLHYCNNAGCSVSCVVSFPALLQHMRGQQQNSQKNRLFLTSAGTLEDILGAPSKILM
jgi:hypothetical protein